ncbi:MAG: VWA domain-containing protein, partial [Spirochaetales bacterium]|nr:VWA domain-containing protein [Spirochaetales bacterium]
ILLLCITAAAWSAGIDVVVMVDISESMFPVFDDVVNYLLRDLLENRLHTGDSFHLLSFADFPEEEIRTDIEDRADLTTVIDRILLLEPLGQYTDLVAAVDFLYAYTRAIPQENRKLVLLLTDGIHDPPPGSPNRLDEKDVLARLLESSEKIRREGWDVHILRMPSEAQPQGADRAGAVPGEDRAGAAQGTDREGAEPGSAESGQDLLDQLSEQLETDVLTYEEVGKESLTDQLTGFSTIDFPGPLGPVRRCFDASFTVNNHAREALSFTLVGVGSPSGGLLRRPVSVTVPPAGTADLVAPLRLPRPIEAGRQHLGIALEFDDPQVRISPLQGALEFEYIPRLARLNVFLRGAWQRVSLTWLLYALGALVLIGVIILLVFVIRHRMQDAAFDRLFAGVAETRKRRLGIRPLILKVDTQNPNIGTRNIHPVPPGSRRSVGGDGSTFLIYYVPMPRRIGEIRNDGKRYLFVPRKAEYFPDLSKTLADCLDKPIRAVSARGREITFHFHEYISPLEELNKLMRSVPKYHIGDVPLKQSPAGGGSGDSEKGK